MRGGAARRESRTRSVKGGDKGARGEQQKSVPDSCPEFLGHFADHLKVFGCRGRRLDSREQNRFSFHIYQI